MRGPFLAIVLATWSWITLAGNL